MLWQRRGGWCMVGGMMEIGTGIWKKCAAVGLVLLLGVVCLAGMVRGCGEVELRDGRYRLVKQAKETVAKANAAAEQQDLATVDREMEKAIALLEKALRRHPGNVAAHRELALLLNHYKGDAPGAIVHYEQYLKLLPEGEGEENREKVEEMLEQCRTGYAAQFVKGSSDLKRELAKREERIRELELQVVRLQESVKPEPGTTIRVPTSEVRAMEQAAPQKKAPRVHVVESGDTLTKISDKYYGTVARWQDILDANRDQLPAANRLKPGMELTIPE